MAEDVKFVEFRFVPKNPQSILLLFNSDGFFCTLGDEQEERSFRGYKRRNDVGGSGFNSGDDVYQFNATRTIFVGNIERNTTSTELKKMFERYGEIVVSITLHTVRSLFICD
jgi:hypothetical protein